MREYGKMLGEYQMGEREGEGEKLRKRNRRLTQKKWRREKKVLELSGIKWGIEIRQSGSDM